ncbi:Branched-chain amino acid aminotransferase/4-amino-4-deoxychorismate lyase [Streptosporangium subroseum]|uniref:Branched-chain amino acid aminotransferase/4-amino-4-deoxychorismate lyase n=1 Tax=Streptosporangium subroseum TaxID=106412 RepID=A0A239NUX5_9ACTN|nr:Branched-chain amino acid aminotransferase/4-amino-4-deoxychorismate lyase [Streptosporangium subroseum]
MRIVSNPAILRIEFDGRPASAEQLRLPALVNYGHFTAMQVRSGKVRGLELHLQRLDASTRELFDAELDHDRVRDHIRHALGDDIGDASVRVYVFGPDTADAVSIMVTVRGPATMPSAPHRLKAVPYQRPVPHIKHIGGFGQIYYGRLAERDGFDQALLTGPGGVIAEGAITNIGFFDGTTVTWPEAPALQGITLQLLEPRLDGAGLPSRRSTVCLADLPSFEAVFITNSQGIAPVGRIDDLTFPVGVDLMKTLAQVYETVPWDTI